MTEWPAAASSRPKVRRYTRTLSVVCKCIRNTWRYRAVSAPMGVPEGLTIGMSRECGQPRWLPTYATDLFVIPR